MTVGPQVHDVLLAQAGGPAQKSFFKSRRYEIATSLNA